MKTFKVWAKSAVGHRYFCTMSCEETNLQNALNERLKSHGLDAVPYVIDRYEDITNHNIKTLTDENYIKILENHFDEQQIVCCGITTNIECSSCIQVQQNIERFQKKYPLVTLNFYYVEYVKYDILQEYHQLERMTEYPKIIVFYGGWDKKEFIEGIITVSELAAIYKVTA